LVFDNRADQRVAQELRRVLGLLSSEQIRFNHEKLGQSQEELAEQLGLTAETIIRWETGALTPTRAMDRYLRVYFGVPAVRSALESRNAIPTLGVELRT
jgi:transcriptional regulator with XRE-family HTH domain